MKVLNFRYDIHSNTVSGYKSDTFDLKSQTISFDEYQSITSSMFEI